MTGPIILHGMMTSQNFGDVLLAQVTSRWLAELTPNRVVAAYATPDVRAILGIERATPQDYLAARAVILSGGGYFQMMDSGLPALKRFVKNTGPLIAGAALRRPMAMIGVGVGVLPHAVMRAALRRLMGACSVVALRDPLSVANALRLTPATTPVETSDLVFSLRHTDVPGTAIERARALRASLPCARVIGLHLSEPSGASASYILLHQRLRIQLEHAPDDLGFVLLEDHSGGPEGSQARAQRELASWLPADRTRIVPYAGTDAMLATLAELDVVFTNKLHVGLAAAAMGTPPPVLGKNRKNMASFEALGLHDNCQMLNENGSEMEPILSQLLQRLPRFEVPDSIRNASMRNKDLLRKFLEK